MPFNALGAIVDALKTWPEPVFLPESLEDANRTQLAEARSRLAQIAQVAGELRRLVDRTLAGQLAGGAFRYGESILTPAYGKAKIIDDEQFYLAVSKGLAQTDDTFGLIAALFPTHSVKTKGLPQLADALGVDAKTLKRTLVDYEAPSSPIKVTALKDAPIWQQKLDEGQFSGEKPE